MSIETPKPQDPNEQALELLKLIPSQLSARWKDELTRKKRPAEEIVGILEEIIAERKGDIKKPFAGIFYGEAEEKIFESNLDSDLKKSTIDLIKKIAHEAKEERIDKIGEGETAKVSISNIDASFCYKVITNPDKYKSGNSVKREMNFLDELTDAEVRGTGVMIPRPYYYQMSPESHICVMQRLDLIKLADITNGTAELPQNFNFENFFASLHKFIAVMHGRGIYHRDLHGGNVLIDKKTGSPCVLDFGAARRDSLSDEKEVYRSIDPKSGKITQIVSDETMISKHKAEIKKLIT